MRLKLRGPVERCRFMKDLRHNAREFAMRKHAGQKRKYTGKP
jgi:hypothetical protein